MGNTSSGPLEIENDPVYKTYDSAGQFSMEKSIRYRVGFGNRTCTIRVTGYGNNDNAYKASVELLDFCDGDEARANLCTGTEKDRNGSRIWSNKITYEGNVAVINDRENEVSLSYGSSLREGFMIIERRKEALLISHSYYCPDKDQCLVVLVEVKCDRRRGLLVESTGPHEDSSELTKLQIFHLLRRGSEGSDSANYTLQPQSAVNATGGLINNVGGQTDGSYNGSVNFINNHYYNPESRKLRAKPKCSDG